MEKLLIIDGNSILNRAYYGIRMLNAPDGTPTNAVYGFLNIFFKYLEEEKFDYVCVAFDVKEKTFRHKMYDLYKAQRKPAPDDFIVQLPVIKEVLSAMNICCIETPGYEADDIIGTVSVFCEKNDVECRILTGDKDDLQLATDKVKINLVITRMGKTETTLMGKDEVFEKYRVTPKEFIDVKGLMGDTSDNIPGVKGIGEKTAFSLIEKYKSIENIYENFDLLEASPSVKKKLEEGKEDALFSKKLATIELNVPMELSFDRFKIKKYDEERLSEIFTRLNFKSFLDKLDIKPAKTLNKLPDYKTKELSADEFLNEMEKGGEIFYRFKGDALVFTRDGEILFFVNNPDISVLKAFFENENIKKIGHDIKDDIIKLNEKGVGFEGELFDTLIAAYILQPEKSTYNLDELALSYLGISLGGEKESDDMQLSFDFDEEEKDDLLFDEASLMVLLKIALEKKIKEYGQEKLLFDIEFPLVKVLADMQICGVYIDKDALFEFGEELKKRIKELEDGIYALSGREFNINSPKQLGEILFEDLKLPHGKKTKTGYSTGVEVLKKLQGEHEIIGLIMEYRHLSKLMSTYVDGLIPVVSDKTGRIHSNFNQTVTATGRISSTEPNLQNIPVRTEIGRELRKMFVAPMGKVLIDADYSQIELRVLAHAANDENMINAFKNDEDIHKMTAAMVFNIPFDEVTSQERTRAKAVNFGIVYGIGEFSLSQDLKIPIKLAKQYIEDYLKTYPSIKNFMNDTISFGREKGYVTTMFERRRYLPELKSTNKNIQAFGERMAMNAPIQGSAADIIKIAMVNVYNALKEKELDAKLILQVHDELIIECPEGEKDIVKEILKTEMENAAALSLPLKVDLESGKSWYDTK